MADINGVVTLGSSETLGEATVLLFNEAGDTIVASTTSDPVTGAYAFTGLAASVYRVAVMGAGVYRSKLYGPCVAGVDPAWADVVLLADMRSPSGTVFTDLSQYGHVLTADGNAAISGGEAVFDGNGDFAWAADSTDWNLGAEFCLEVFGVRVDSLAAPQTLLSHYDAYTPFTDNRGWLFRMDASGALAVTISTAGVSAGTVAYTSTSVIPAGTYNICVDRYAGNLHFYVNGVRLGTPVACSAIPFDSASYLAIGATNARGSTTDRSYLTGGMKAARITRASRYAGAASYTVPPLPLPQQ